MEPIETLRREKDAIKRAPWSFAIVTTVITAILYGVLQFTYAARIEHLNGEVERLTGELTDAKKPVPAAMPSAPSGMPTTTPSTGNESRQPTAAPPSIQAPNNQGIVAPANQGIVTQNQSGGSNTIVHKGPPRTKTGVYLDGNQIGDAMGPVSIDTNSSKVHFQELHTDRLFDPGSKQTFEFQKYRLSCISTPARYARMAGLVSAEMFDVNCDIVGPASDETPQTQ